MIIYLEKYLHVILAMSLFGACVLAYGLSVFNWREASIAHRQFYNNFLQQLDYFIYGVIVLLILTGTLLVYPKGFTFHTPWIIAAYFLLGINSILLFLTAYLRKKAEVQQQRWQSISLGMWLTYHALQIILIVSFVLIIHDAVTKQTLVSL
ncbi:MAG: hypothetical protein KIT27_07820 [Legionellales bacterium]|nr:hypothetical protein [Legionellales bacterium]